MKLYFCFLSNFDFPYLTLFNNANLSFQLEGTWGLEIRNVVSQSLTLEKNNIIPYLPLEKQNVAFKNDQDLNYLTTVNAFVPDYYRPIPVQVDLEDEVILENFF